MIFLYVKELHSRKHQLPILWLQLEGGSNPLVSQLQPEGSSNSPILFQPEGGSNPLILRLQPEGSSNSLVLQAPTKRWIQPPILSHPTTLKYKCPNVDNLSLVTESTTATVTLSLSTCTNKLSQPVPTIFKTFLQIHNLSTLQHTYVHASLHCNSRMLHLSSVQLADYYKLSQFHYHCLCFCQMSL
jgi:hypothetical protein